MPGLFWKQEILGTFMCWLRILSKVEKLCLLHNILVQFCRESWHMQMTYMGVIHLTELSKWDFLYGKKFRFCEHCARRNLHRGIAFGDSALLCLSK